MPMEANSVVSNYGPLIEGVCIGGRGTYKNLMYHV